MRSTFVQDEVRAQVDWSNVSQQEKPKSNELTLSHATPLTWLKTRNFYRLSMLALLFGICTLFYYFGELVTFAGWEALRWKVFYDVHDIHRLLFFVPIMYACYFFGFKAMSAVTAASLLVFLPRAIFISPFSDAIPRSLIFVVAAGCLCYFIRMMRHRLQGYNDVEAVIRREKNNFVGVQKRIGDRVFIPQEIEIDLSMRLVKRQGQIVKLTPTEYKLLEYLIRNSGKVLTQTEILHNVWGPQYGQESEYVRNFIRQLRRKIEDDPSNPRFIVTEPRFGYRFCWPEGMLNNHPS
jgi:DNA-binding winged helix-turn-helix (wHTH) protein